MMMTIINTKLGQIQGEYKDGLYLFKGIKYGKANRFEAPQPYTWKGVFNATSFSKKAPLNFKVLLPLFPLYHRPRCPAPLHHQRLSPPLQQPIQAPTPLNATCCGRC